MFSKSGRTWFSLCVKWGDGPGSHSGEEGEVSRTVDRQQGLGHLGEGRCPRCFVAALARVSEARGLTCASASVGAFGGGGPRWTSVSWELL